MIGKVKFFMAEKRFGFVANEGGEWYFHERDILGDAPRRGDDVDFWLSDDQRETGLVAAEVRKRARN